MLISQDQEFAPIIRVGGVDFTDEEKTNIRQDLSEMLVNSDVDMTGLSAGIGAFFDGIEGLTSERIVEGVVRNINSAVDPLQPAALPTLAMADGPDAFYVYPPFFDEKDPSAHTLPASHVIEAEQAFAKEYTRQLFALVFGSAQADAEQQDVLQALTASASQRIAEALSSDTVRLWTKIASPIIRRSMENDVALAAESSITDVISDKRQSWGFYLSADHNCTSTMPYKRIFTAVSNIRQWLADPFGKKVESDRAALDLIGSHLMDTGAISSRQDMTGFFTAFRRQLSAKEFRGWYQAMSGVGTGKRPPELGAIPAFLPSFAAPIRWFA